MRDCDLFVTRDPIRKCLEARGKGPIRAQCRGLRSQFKSIHYLSRDSCLFFFCSFVAREIRSFFPKKKEDEVARKPVARWCPGDVSVQENESLLLLYARNGPGIVRLSTVCTHS